MTLTIDLPSHEIIRRALGGQPVFELDTLVAENLPDVDCERTILLNAANSYANHAVSLADQMRRAEAIYAFTRSFDLITQYTILAPRNQEGRAAFARILEVKDALHRRRAFSDVYEFMKAVNPADHAKSGLAEDYVK
jgi:hypothetical protein